MEKKTLGSFLAALRKANGMTQKDLADRLNVSDKAVSRWERDENCPDLTLIPVIADIFGVTSDELLRGERITAETPKSSEKSDRQLRYLVDNLVYRYIVGAVIAIAAVIGGIILCMCVSAGVTVKSTAGQIMEAMTVTIMWLLWIAALLYIVLRYWAIRRQLTVPEGTEFEETGKKRVNRIFWIAIIFLVSLIFIMGFADSTGSDFELGFLLFLATFAGLLLGFPLLRKIFREFLSHRITAEQARKNFRKRVITVTVLFLLLWGAVLWLGETTNGTFFAPGKWFADGESFRNYMETVTEDEELRGANVYGVFGKPVVSEYYEWSYDAEDGTEIRRWVWDERGGLFQGDLYRIGDVTFEFRNGEVSSVLFFGTDHIFPARAFTETAENIGFAIWVFLLIGIPVLCYLAVRREKIRASRFSEAIEEESLLQPKNAQRESGEAASAETGDPDEVATIEAEDTPKTGY